MTKLKFIIIILIFIYTLNAKELDKITIQLDWLNQFQFAGYYIAKEKGFYKDENLDVSIIEYDKHLNVANRVLNNKNFYGVGKSSLIIDRLNGKKVILLSAIFQSSPMVLISRKDSNINKPSDLKNKTVMLTNDAITSVPIHAMILSQGLKISDINFKEHSFNIDDLINKKVDVMGCFLSNEPYILEKKSIKYSVIDPKDYGFNFYEGILFTSKNELDQHPQRVKGVYKATLRGWKYAFNHIEETAKLIFDKYNTQNKSLDALIYEGKYLKKISKIDEGLLGNIDKDKIDEIKRLYLLSGYCKNINNPSKSGDFIYDYSYIHNTVTEKEYLNQTKLTLLSDNNFPPFTIMINNKLTGIELDYWNLIVKKLGLKNSDIEIQNDNEEAIKKVIKNSNYIKYAYDKKDIGQNTATTDTITEIKIGIAASSSEIHISDIKQLNGKKIAIIKDSSYTQEIKKSYPKIDFINTNNIDESLELLKGKRVYAAISKMPTLNYYISKKSLNDIKIVGAFDEKYELKLVVNAENKILLNLLNKAISSISDEDREQISIKYYSVIFQNGQDYSEFYKILIPLVIIIILVARSNRAMNKEIKRRKEVEKKLKIMINIDPLTEIYNRRKIKSLLNQEIQRYKRYKRNFSIIFFDIDNFKSINDTLGHSSGDEVLINLSKFVKCSIRDADFFGRWGGEEFIIILPETNKDKASNIAHALKEKIASSDLGINKQITCSFGVSQFEETDNQDSIISRVDHAMYNVKQHGKNGVKVI